jgi:hypothetical protein
VRGCERGGGMRRVRRKRDSEEGEENIFIF